MIEKDLFGQALHDYWHNLQPEDMITWTNLTEPEVLPTAYLFRTYDEMPVSEQKALQLARGTILDVGAGSGTHSLWLQKQQHDVTALELSPISCQLMKDRGIQKIVQANFFNYKGPKYDSILFLMNGIGIVEKAQYTDKLFQKLKDLLKPNGQAFIHSSDLKYLYETGGGYTMPQAGYYGDVQFFVSYKNEVESFNWTYIDEQTLKSFAQQNGFKAEKIIESELGDFLLKVSIK